ncbi:MAG TPA: HD-GYP domain-containing protein [Candidatus Binatia bacterium]|nr:HD-GYP domain-containing protein [Candidatus Binatia bacterium]
MRLTFLAKFTLATFVVAVVATVALAYTLATAHIRAVERDEMITATGQIVAALTPALTELSEVRANDPRWLEMLRNGVGAGQRNQFAAAIRVYAPDGRAIFPKGAPAQPVDVAATIARQDIWSRDMVSSGIQTRTEYAPFAQDGRIAAVIAIDFPIDQMAAQAAGEQKTVIFATVATVALIFLTLVAMAAGASRELELRRRQAEGTFAQTLGVLAETLELRDPYTAGHSRRVSEYSRELARALRLSPREIDVITNAALLHDIGKIGIPDRVLLKDGALDERDRAIVGKHPVMGAQIIGSISSMEDVAPCVMHHHERVDGTGYPGCLIAEAIPLGARIIAVADTFDAMTTDRPYRRALSMEVALTEMQRIAGTQLDVSIVTRFVQIALAGKVVPPPAALDESELRFGPLLGLKGAV